MGNKASKLETSRRSLKFGTGSYSADALNATRSTRPLRNNQNEYSSQEKDGGSTLANRLLKLGQARSKTIDYKYKPASEDNFLITLAARSKLESKTQTDLNSRNPRTSLPAATVTALLDSLRSGESTDTVLKIYNVDAGVLPQLEAISLPRIPTKNLPNELLQENRNSELNAERKPVRRKRISKR